MPYLRTAAYCRVSSKKDEQYNSLENQSEYYTEYIKSHIHLVFSGIYADKMSGCRMGKRPALQALLLACRDGKIDLVITKSVKRLGRNTVETLALLNELKALGIDVYFELEHLHLKDPKSMFLITIMAGLAQNESYNLSRDIRWGIRHGFGSGTSKMVSRVCYDYIRNRNGQLTIQEHEARIVRWIFKWRATELSLPSICRRLERRGITSPNGKRWYPETIRKILSNEKYTGNVVLQKTYTPDFLSGKQIKNIGQVDRYYWQNTHEAIISMELFNKVNAPRL